MASDENKIEKLANFVAEEFDAQVHLYSGAIDADGFGELLKTLELKENQPLKKNVVLILTTSGGLANAAYRISRTLQTTFERFFLYVPAYCKSAGTLVAIGANEIIMEEISELGPLDVQLVQRDEIGQRKSGLVIRTAFEGLAQETLDVFDRIMLGIKVASQGSISFDTASKIASNIAPAVMAPVYAQINPEDLGNDLRDLHVATQYGKRLARYGGNCDGRAVEHFVSGYPSHDFIIDRCEAEDLFKTVSSPSENLALLTNELSFVVYSEQTPKAVFRLDNLEVDNDDNRKAESGGDIGEAGGEGASDSSDVVTGRSQKGRSGAN